MRRRFVWLVTLPLALIGSELGHSVVNALIGPPGGEFESEGLGAELVPWLASAAAAVVLLALLGRAAGVWTSPRRRLSALPFACLAPLVFVLQEHLEALLRNGAIPHATVSERTFLPGLAIQLPFAVVGYLVARGLLRLSDGVRRLIVRRQLARRAAPRVVVVPRPADVPRPAVLSLTGHFGRAPPAGHATSG